eukprot:SAG31_NODE_43129_length_268_cov_0.911243_1_plen_43_part_01
MEWDTIGTTALELPISETAMVYASRTQLSQGQAVVGQDCLSWT